MHHPVGERHDAGEAGAGDVREGAVDGGEQGGAVAAGLGHDDGAHLEVRHARGLGGELGECGVADRGAVAHPHRIRLVDDEQADVGDGVAGFLDQARSGEPEQQDDEGEAAPQHAARAAAAWPGRVPAGRSAARPPITQSGTAGSSRSAA